MKKFLLLLLSMTLLAPVANAQTRTAKDVEADMDELYGEIEVLENELFEISNGYVLTDLRNEVVETNQLEYKVTQVGRYFNVFPYSTWVIEVTNISDKLLVPYDLMVDDIYLYEEDEKEAVEAGDYKFYPVFWDGDLLTYDYEYNWDAKMKPNTTVIFTVMIPENPYVERYLEVAEDIRIDAEK